MNLVKIALVVLAISFATFVSLVGYQSISGSNHNHGDFYSSDNVAPASFADANYQGQTRTYYIAADEVKWDFAPTGINQITGKPFDDTANVYMENGKDRIGKVSLKAVYREYTDNTFAKLTPISDKWQHLGILGPVIHAEVGDTIKVVFKNNARFPFSIHPHGVFYQKDSEGAPYNDGIPDSEKKGDAVQPGENYTYVWQVPERAGPGPHDPSSIVWMYHSHVDEVSDTYAGLAGPIIVTRHGEANPDGTPKGVDQEFVTLFAIFNENNSPYLDYNIKTFAQDPSSVNVDDADFQESNMRHAINGYMYGNLPGLVMKANTHVRWYVMGMGTETDLHTPHWHGETLVMDGMRTDMVELLPMSMKVLDMYPDNVGTWLYHCHVNDHISAGMLSLFTVQP
ncbi:putative Multicopper oxidase [Nitrosotalea devaniterrae]|uniref:Putative Multicopper oxidase n=1 Tax=Nitrosotalea devaniterrae TaxID=1078905 RepID=A0A128A287_9ARCH|nr:putative Multicopper oxidase [Candidatus Nitrosotalea devanaterra]